MRLVYWNIRAGGGVRVPGIADQIRRWRPDVVGLSEFRGTPASQALAGLLAEQGLVYHLSATDSQWPARNAVFLASRRPLRRLHLRRAPKEASRWLLARTESGLTVGVMHAPNYVTGHKQTYFDAVLALTAAWRGGPGIIGGDTNTGVPPLDGPPATFHDWEIDWIGRLRRNHWFDIFRERYPRTAAPTWFSPNRQTGYRLDQAFVHHDLRQAVRAVRYRWGRPRRAPATAPATAPVALPRHVLSDHAALILDLQLELVADSNQAPAVHIDL